MVLLPLSYVLSDDEFQDRCWGPGGKETTIKIQLQYASLLGRIRVDEEWLMHADAMCYGILASLLAITL